MSRTGALAIVLSLAFAVGPGLVVAGGPEKPSADEPLALAARAVLARHCYRCHGQDGAAEGGFNTVLDRGRVVRRKAVVPGHPAKSPLYKRVAALEMPPEDEETRPTEAETATLRRWIEAGAPDWASPSSRRFITVEDEARLVREDLARYMPTVARPLRRDDIKYFTLTPLYNAGYTDDELQTVRMALAKLLNGLSWRPEIVLPEPINPERTLYRIDLPAFGWDHRHWFVMSRLGPYNAGFRQDADRPAQPLPLRADWFIEDASKPPRYHDVVCLPRTVGELEALLKVNASEDIRGGKVIRAGFGQSGVSRNNRMIERHQGPYGYYWKSYDFGSSKGRRSILAYPIGPGASAEGATFQHDGGEIIFRLPNGLQGYMLTDGRGNRLDRGPAEIVSDPKHPDRVVENGISCLSCHTGGFVDKADQVRGLAEGNNTPLAGAGRDAILRLYPPRATFEAALRRDAEDYRKALAKLGIKPGGAEPINVTARRFEAELDVRQAAAEFWLSPEEFTTRLGKLPSHASGELVALLAPDGTVKRDVFQARYPSLVRRLQPALESSGTGRGASASAKGTWTVELLPGELFLLAEPISAFYSEPPFGPCPTVDPTFRWLALVTRDNVRVQIHELATGRGRHITPVLGRVSAFAFSPDGEILATSAEKKTISLLEMNTWRELTAREDPEKMWPPLWSRALAFEPDGKALAMADGRQGVIRFVDATTGRMLSAIDQPNRMITTLEYTGDGSELLSADGRRGATVRITSLKTGETRRVEGFKPNSLMASTVSPDRKWIAFGFTDNTVRLRDAPTLGDVAEARVEFVGGHGWGATVRAAAFRPDSKILAALHTEGAISLWTVPELRLLGAFRAYTSDQLRTVRFSPDGRRLATGAADGSVRVWDAEGMSKAGE